MLVFTLSLPGGLNTNLIPFVLLFVYMWVKLKLFLVTTIVEAGLIVFLDPVKLILRT